MPTTAVKLHSLPKHKESDEEHHGQNRNTAVALSRNLSE